MFKTFKLLILKSFILLKVYAGSACELQQESMPPLTRVIPTIQLLEVWTNKFRKVHEDAFKPSIPTSEEEEYGESDVPPYANIFEAMANSLNYLRDTFKDRLHIPAEREDFFIEFFERHPGLFILATTDSAFTQQEPARALFLSIHGTTFKFPQSWQAIALLSLVRDEDARYLKMFDNTFNNVLHIYYEGLPRNLEGYVKHVNGIAPEENFFLLLPNEEFRKHIKKTIRAVTAHQTKSYEEANHDRGEIEEIIKRENHDKIRVFLLEAKRRGSNLEFLKSHYDIQDLRAIEQLNYIGRNRSFRIYSEVITGLIWAQLKEGTERGNTTNLPKLVRILNICRVIKQTEEASKIRDYLLTKIDSLTPHDRALTRKFVGALYFDDHQFTEAADYYTQVLEDSVLEDEDYEEEDYVNATWATYRVGNPTDAHKNYLRFLAKQRRNNDSELSDSLPFKSHAYIGIYEDKVAGQEQAKKRFSWLIEQAIEDLEDCLEVIEEFLNHGFNEIALKLLPKAFALPLVENYKENERYRRLSKFYEQRKEIRRKYKEDIQSLCNSYRLTPHPSDTARSSCNTSHTKHNKRKRETPKSTQVIEDTSTTKKHKQGDSENEKGKEKEVENDKITDRENEQQVESHITSCEELSTLEGLRIIEGYQAHRDLLDWALKTVKERITITDHGNLGTDLESNNYSLNRLIKEAKQRSGSPGCSRAIQVYYRYSAQGSEDDRQPKILKYLDKILNVDIMPLNIHAKIVTVDNHTVVIGSFNWLCDYMYQDPKTNRWRYNLKNFESPSYNRSIIYSGKYAEDIREVLWGELSYFTNDKFIKMGSGNKGNERATQKRNANLLNLVPRKYTLGGQSKLILLQTTLAHRLKLISALKRAQRQVIIVSPFITRAYKACKTYMRDFSKGILEEGLQRGVKILFLVDKTQEVSEAFRTLEHTLGLIILPYKEKFHNKTLIVDEYLIAEGSFNWLQSARDEQDTYHKYEATLVYEGARARILINEFYRSGMGAFVKKKLEETPARSAISVFNPQPYSTHKELIIQEWWANHPFWKNVSPTCWSMQYGNKTNKIVNNNGAFIFYINDVKKGQYPSLTEAKKGSYLNFRREQKASKSASHLSTSMP